MAILLYSGKIAIACIFHEVTGLYCPGCGITRACLAIIELDFYQAFRYNSLVCIYLPIIIITSIIDLKCKNNIKIKKVTNIIYIMLLVIALIYGVLRNIPYFSFLAPIEV